MQPAQQTGLPTGAFPATDRLAIDDPYTRIWFDYLVRAGRRNITSAAVLLVVGVVFLVPTAYQPTFYDQVMLWLLGFLFLFTVVVAVINNGVRRLSESAFRRYPWHAVAATVVGARPCVLAVHLGPSDEPVYVRVPRARIGLYQVALRSGRVWLCGPDERGRVMVRVDGLSLGGPGKVIERPKADMTPPARLEATGARPADEPLLAWALRRRARAQIRMVGSLAVLLVAGVVVLVVGFSQSDTSALTFGVFSVIYVVLMVALVLRGQRSNGPVLKLIRAAESWTPLVVRMDSWEPQQRVFGPARGEVWLPDGSSAPVVLPRAGVDLIANIQASRTLWVAGQPRRGAVMAVGVPGYPLFGLGLLG